MGKHQAMELNALDSDSPSVWQALAPQLDAAMDTLDLNDRDAVVLRFFKGKSLREVGRALGTSEDAAQKRVTRALEKLRSYFARQGIAATGALIAAELSAHAVQSAPAGLAAGIAATSLAGAAGGGTTAWALKFVELMTATNLIITAGALVVIAAATAPILLGRHAPPPEAPSAPGMVGTAQPDADPAPSLAVQPAQPPTSKESLLDRLAAESATELTAEQIEAYLQRNNRSAESLLAAFRVSFDKKYLLEAAASFPNDPRVQFATIANDAFPGENRKWIDAFKTSASDNSLAWYFSALDYFRSKQPDLAVRELSEATGRESFENYGPQICQAIEEMCRQAARHWRPNSKRRAAAEPRQGISLG